MFVVVNFLMISDLNTVLAFFITNLNWKRKKNQTVLNGAKQPFERGCTFRSFSPPKRIDEKHFSNFCSHVYKISSLANLGETLF